MVLAILNPRRPYQVQAAWKIIGKSLEKYCDNYGHLWLIYKENLFEK